MNPRWLTETVVGLARAIIADGAFEHLPILADALEEAGCDDAEVLDAMREGEAWTLCLFPQAEWSTNRQTLALILTSAFDELKLLDCESPGLTNPRQLRKLSLLTRCLEPFLVDKDNLETYIRGRFTGTPK